MNMLPVLFSLGPIQISSFGLFMALGFLVGTYLIWKLAKTWEIQEEKVLDLILLTFFGGLIGARIYFILLNSAFFKGDIYKMLFVTKYPGLSFWGGFLGGWLVLFYFCRRFKMDFRRVADIGAVGFLAGLVLGDIGCFLGGCGVGVPSNLFFAAPMVGLIGHRFPVQMLEAVLFAFILWSIWPKAKWFHFPGQILSKTLIYIGVVKFITEFFRDYRQGGFFLSLCLIVLGVVTYYQASKRNILGDARSAWKYAGNKRNWLLVLDRLKNTWYNLLTRFSIDQVKKVLRRMRVKPTPKDL